MRKGIAIFGVILLILGFVSLVIGFLAYSNYNNLVNAYGGLGLLNQSVYNQAQSDYSVGIGGIIGGGIFVIIGIILTIVGFKAKSKKEKRAETGKQ
jgi:uncharacterized membrane protein